MQVKIRYVFISVVHLIPILKLYNKGLNGHLHINKINVNEQKMEDSSGFSGCAKSSGDRMSVFNNGDDRGFCAPLPPLLLMLVTKILFRPNASL